MKRSFHSAFQPVMCLSDGCDSFIMSHPTVYFNHHSTAAPSTTTTMSTTQNNHYHHFNNQQSSFDQHQMIEDNENVPPPHPLYKRTKLSSKPSHVMTNNGYCIRNFHVDLNKNNNNNNNNSNETRVDSWDYSNTSHVQHLNFLKTFASSSTTASSSSSGNASQSRQNMNNNYNNNNNMIADQILMYLTVCTMNGKKMIVALNRQEATVYDVKQSILRKMNIAPDKQILLFEGRPLNDLSLNLYHQCHLRTGHAIQIISPMTYQP